MTDKKLKYITSMHFNKNIDITDPCYDRESECIEKATVKPGNYHCVIEESDEQEWGNRVSKIAIIHEDLIDKDTPTQKELIDLFNNEFEELDLAVGVDAGLAGFFNNKKDYDDEQWSDFCDKLRNNENAWSFDDGFFSSSGYGDGIYGVCALKDANTRENIMLYIDFIPDEFEDWDDDYDDEEDDDCDDE